MVAVRRRKKARATTGDVVIETVKVPTKSLNPYYRNPRRGDVEKVAESLQENKQFKPIVVNKGTLTGRPNEILAGNHTWLGIRKLGWTETLVSWVDVDEGTAKKIVIADNAAGDNSTYDNEELLAILGEVQEEFGSLIGTTFTDDVLGKLIASEEDPNSNIDKIEDAPENLEGVADLGNDVIFMPSRHDYDIPELREDMLLEDVPQPLDVYAGIELDGKDVREDYDEIWWLAMWHAGSRGINWKQTIPMFYCVDDQTEALTQRGWVGGYDLKKSDQVLSMRPDGVLAWSGLRGIFREQYNGKMHRLTKNNIDALVTPGHSFALTDGSLKKVEQLSTKDVLRVFGEAEEETAEVYSDAFVEVVGWAVTEGHYVANSAGVMITQKTGTPTEDQIRLVLKRAGIEASESKQGANCTGFYVPAKHGKKIRKIAPNRVLAPEFILDLSREQRMLLVDVMIQGDGWEIKGAKTRCYTQQDKAHADAFVMLCSLAGIPTSVQERKKQGWTMRDYYVVTLKVEKTAYVRSVDFHGGNVPWHDNVPVERYEGLVWCPTTDYGTFVCRRNGVVYVTGNTEDFHFYNVFTEPAKNTKKILNLGITAAIMPNYSIGHNWPVATWVWAVYRSFYVARYFQEAGIKVIPDIQYGTDDEVIDLSLLAIPEGAPVCSVQIQNARGDTNYIRRTARVLKEAENRVQFENLIVYGHTDAESVLERAGLECNIVRVAARTARRREYLNSESTINSQQVASKGKRRRIKR